MMHTVHMHVRLVPALVVVALVSGCTGRFPTGNPTTCDADNCEGCCRAGECESGTTSDACGVDGNSCSVCDTTSHLCAAGTCARRCVQHAECNEPELCVSGACRDPFGRSYSLLLVSADVPAENPSTQAGWDVGSAPDPQVVFSVNKIQRARTPIIRDDATPAFHQSFEATVMRGTSVDLEIWDDDGMEGGGRDRIEVLEFSSGVDFMTYVRQGGLQNEAAVLGGVRWTLQMNPR